VIALHAFPPLHELNRNPVKAFSVKPSWCPSWRVMICTLGRGHLAFSFLRNAPIGKLVEAGRIQLDEVRESLSAVARCSIGFCLRADDATSEAATECLESDEPVKDPHFSSCKRRRVKDCRDLPLRPRAPPFNNFAVYPDDTWCALTSACEKCAPAIATASRVSREVGLHRLATFGGHNVPRT
jgi:hypothetical protein